MTDGKDTAGDVPICPRPVKIIGRGTHPGQGTHAPAHARSVHALRPHRARITAASGPHHGRTEPAPTTPHSHHNRTQPAPTTPDSHHNRTQPASRPNRARARARAREVAGRLADPVKSALGQRTADSGSRPGAAATRALRSAAIGQLSPSVD
ncbi:hypothetical protein SSPO_055530 [Streptomyces antimycoticus]|uniref:Uncharacterized protein n=1 Tax=Streptomyces antimycoticus TaxID=68175 RepID=A0A499ULI5_9ACTN|nr:hypothetical protein SSPO_055530 [Streptomyces antimycoticus]